MFFSPLLLSFSNASEGLALKGGLNIAWTKLSALNSSVEHAPAAGFNTHFTYRKKSWSLDLSSYINFSGFTDLDLKAQETELSRVDGDVRNLSLAPLLKYHTEYEIIPNWNLYFGIGPLGHF